jgi:hypothetical protein
VSVSSAAYLYQPDEPFHASSFEFWFHRSHRYQPDERLTPEESLPDDYTPAYSWLEAATEQLRARAKAIPKAVAPFRLVPVPQKELQYDEESAVWDSECNNPRICLLESIRLLEMARQNKKNLSYKDQLEYVREIQRLAREYEREIQPSLGSRIMRLVGRDED